MRSMLVGALKTCCARSKRSSASTNFPARWSWSPSLKSCLAAERSDSVTWALAGRVMVSADAAPRARRRRSARMGRKDQYPGSDEGCVGAGAAVALGVADLAGAAVAVLLPG